MPPSLPKPAFPMARVSTKKELSSCTQLYRLAQNAPPLEEEGRIHNTTFTFKRRGTSSPTLPCQPDLNKRHSFSPPTKETEKKGQNVSEIRGPHALRHCARTLRPHFGFGAYDMMLKAACGRRGFSGAARGPIPDVSGDGPTSIIGPWEYFPSPYTPQAHTASLLAPHTPGWASTITYLHEA